MTEQETIDRPHDVTPEQPLPDEEYYRRQPLPRPDRSAARLGMLLVIVGLIWLAVELVGYGPFFGGSQSVTLIDAPLPGNRLDLDLGSSQVDVQTGGDREVRVETTQHGLWQGNPVAISRLGDRVRVTNEAFPRFFGFCFGRCGMSYHITAPRGVALSVRTSSGDISVAGVDGAVSLTSGSGDVTAHDIANGLTVATSSGDVALERVGGKLNVQTGSGDVRLADGHVVDATVQANSGDIELQGVANTIALNSGSGDIDVRDAHDGQLAIRANSGNIDYTGSLARAANSSVETSSGDVTLRLPGDSSFILEANTSSGDLENAFTLANGQRGRQSLSGVAGADGHTLKIATSSGDISIERQ
jgi:hypothetical protein